MIIFLLPLPCRFLFVFFYQHMHMYQRWKGGGGSRPAGRPACLHSLATSSLPLVLPLIFSIYERARGRTRPFFYFFTYLSFFDGLGTTPEVNSDKFPLLSFFGGEKKKTGEKSKKAKSSKGWHFSFVEYIYAAVFLKFSPSFHSTQQLDPPLSSLVFFFNLSFTSPSPLSPSFNPSFQLHHRVLNSNSTCWPF